MNLFIIGKECKEGWSTQGVFTTEQNAIDACIPECFLIEVEADKKIPAKAEEAIKLYWPCDEKWEESNLYLMRQKKDV